MNIIIALFILALSLLMVRPALANNRTLVDSLFPAVIQSSLKFPLLPESQSIKEAKINGIQESQIHGSVRLLEVPKTLKTQIVMKFSGLKPDEQYVPIYHQNEDCSAEPGSVNKSIQGAFFADSNGQGEVQDIVHESIKRIGSISLRTAKDFKLTACGTI